MEKSWFTERIGQKVVRSFTYLDKTEETEFEVTEKNAGYLWLLTEKGYTFRDVATVAITATVSEMETVSAENAHTDDDWLEAARPKVRLHVAMNGDGTNSKMCVGACEG